VIAEAPAHLVARRGQSGRCGAEQGARFEGLTIPTQVNYVGKGADLYRLGYKPSGAASVISKYLRTSWLWEKVRVQGGAYGGFCLFDHRSGGFTYLSYRDPNLLATLDIYDQTAAFLRESELSQHELTKSIIGAIGEVDQYQLPDAKGYSSMLRYLVGDTDEIRQRMREEILGTSPADFLDFADALGAETEGQRDIVRDGGLMPRSTAGQANSGTQLLTLDVFDNGAEERPVPRVVRRKLQPNIDGRHARQRKCHTV